MHLRHVTLPKQNGAGGIQAAGEETRRRFEGEPAQIVRLGHRGERVVIGDEINRAIALLQFDRRLHHPEIVAQVQRTRRLDAG